MPANSLLQRVKKIRISDTVVDQIVSLIEEGKLKVGDQLPGERELVDQLQVGRASVREALRILEAQGVVQVQPGRGTFVIGDVTHLSGSEGVRTWFEDHADEVRSILELREALERKAVYLAAQRASDEIIARLEELVQSAELNAAQNRQDELVAVDQQFHGLLGRASGNDLLSELIDGTIVAMVSPRRSILRLPERSQISAREHRVIWEAVRNRDPEAAEAALLQHMNSVRSAIGALSGDMPDSWLMIRETMHELD